MAKSMKTPQATPIATPDPITTKTPVEWFRIQDKVIQKLMRFHTAY